MPLINTPKGLNLRLNGRSSRKAPVFALSIREAMKEPVSPKAPHGPKRMPKPYKKDSFKIDRQLLDGVRVKPPLPRINTEFVTALEKAVSELQRAKYGRLNFHRRASQQGWSLPNGRWMTYVVKPGVLEYQARYGRRWGFYVWQ